MTFETNDNYSIQFEISNNSSTVQFDSIRNEKTLRTALNEMRYINLCFIYLLTYSLTYLLREVADVRAEANVLYSLFSDRVSYLGMIFG